MSNRFSQNVIIMWSLCMQDYIILLSSRQTDLCSIFFHQNLIVLTFAKSSSVFMHPVNSMSLNGVKKKYRWWLCKRGESTHLKPTNLSFAHTTPTHAQTHIVTHAHDVKNTSCYKKQREKPLPADELECWEQFHWCRQTSDMIVV